MPSKLPGLDVNDPTPNAAQTASPNAVLGELVWLYSMSPLHRGWPISSIHRWLLPPLKFRQYRLYHRDARPIGFVSWAHLSVEAEQRYIHAPSGLQETDWQSGDLMWAIDFVAPFGDAKEIARDLRDRVFPDKQAKFLRLKAPGADMRIMYVNGRKAAAGPRQKPALMRAE